MPPYNPRDRERALAAAKAVKPKKIRVKPPKQGASSSWNESEAKRRARDRATAASIERGHKKPPPILVPSFEAPRPLPPPPKPPRITPTMMDVPRPRPPRGRPHLPRDFTYVNPSMYAAASLNKLSGTEKRQVERYNQQRELERRKSQREMRSRQRGILSLLARGHDPWELQQQGHVGQGQSIEDFIKNGKIDYPSNWDYTKAIAGTVGNKLKEADDWVNDVPSAALRVPKLLRHAYTQGIDIERPVRAVDEGLGDFTKTVYNYFADEFRKDAANRKQYGVLKGAAKSFVDWTDKQERELNTLGDWVIGPNIMKVAGGDTNVNPGMFALELGIMFVPIKGVPSVASVGLRKLAGRAADESIILSRRQERQIARQINIALGNVKFRQVWDERLGQWVESAMPDYETRVGRGGSLVFEKVRKATSGVPTPWQKGSQKLMKEEERASRSTFTALRTYRARKIGELGQKLNDEDYYALRVIAHNRGPEQEARYARLQAQKLLEAGDEAGAAFQEQHALMFDRVAEKKLVFQSADGVWHLDKDNVSPTLARIDRLWGEQAPMREAGLMKLGILDPETILRRIDAPTAEIDLALSGLRESADRNRIYANLQELDPKMADSWIQLFDARALAYAERLRNAVDDTYKAERWKKENGQPFDEAKLDKAARYRVFGIPNDLYYTRLRRINNDFTPQDIEHIKKTWEVETDLEKFTKKRRGKRGDGAKVEFAGETTGMSQEERDFWDHPWNMRFPVLRENETGRLFFGNPGDHHPDVADRYFGDWPGWYNHFTQGDVNLDGPEILAVHAPPGSDEAQVARLAQEHLDHFRQTHFGAEPTYYNDFGPAGGERLPSLSFKFEGPQLESVAKKAPANLRQKLKPTRADHVHTNPTIRRKGMVIAGPVSNRAWVTRVMKTMPTKKERQYWAKWYEHFEPAFRKAFGNDADAIMRGFALSQANTSPAGGLGAVLKVMERLRNGEEVTNEGIGMIAQAVKKAVENSPLEKGAAAKLSDFMDALALSRTRTWMGHEAAGGAPAPADVWAARDLGWVDKKFAKKLKDVFGVDAQVDSTGAPSGVKYEQISEQYADLTKHLNKIRFDGRSNWRPAQVQALGWASVQKMVGTDPEDLRYALSRNAYELAFEVTQGPDNLGGDLTIDEALKVAQELELDIGKLVEDTEGVYLLPDQEFVYTTGGWAQGQNGAVQFKVVGDADGVARLITRIAKAFDQEWVQASRRTSSQSAKPKSALVIYSKDFSDEKKKQAFFEELALRSPTSRNSATKQVEDEIQGYMRGDDVEGQPSIAIRTHRAAATGKAVAPFLDRYEKAIEEAAREAGVDVGYTHQNLALLTGGQNGLEDPLLTAKRGSGAAGSLDDHLAAQIRAKLEAAIDRVRAEAGRAKPAGPSAEELAGRKALADEEALYNRVISSQEWPDNEQSRGYVPDFLEQNPEFAPGWEDVLDKARLYRESQYPDWAKGGSDSALFNSEDGGRLSADDLLGWGRARGFDEVYSERAIDALSPEDKRIFADWSERYADALYAEGEHPDVTGELYRLADYARGGPAYKGEGPLTKRIHGLHWAKEGPFGKEGEVSISKRTPIKNLTLAHEVIGHFNEMVAGLDEEFQTALKEYGILPEKFEGLTDEEATVFHEKFAQLAEAYTFYGGKDLPVRVREAYRELSSKVRQEIKKDLWGGPRKKPKHPEGEAELFAFFDKMHSWEDALNMGQRYAPETRGAPQDFRKGFARFRKSEGQARSYWSGKAPMSVLGTDPATKHRFQARLMQSGYFKGNITEGIRRSGMQMGKLLSFADARKAFLRELPDGEKVATLVPLRTTDIPIRDNITHGFRRPGERSGQVSKMLDMIHSMEIEEGKIDVADLEDFTEEELNSLADILLPADLDGADPRKIARQIIDGVLEPIPNIRWISKEQADAFNLLDSRVIEHADKLWRALDGGLKGVDALNAWARLQILFLNPAYYPMNFIGNGVMNVMQQGVFYLPNRSLAYSLSQDIGEEWASMIDSVMGTTLTESMGFREGGADHAIRHFFNHYATMLVDMVPRRAAFIHEARRMGFDEAWKIKGLLQAADAGDEEAQKLLHVVATRARDAIVDYDRLSPIERDVVSRLIFFYPWIKGATRWTAQFPLKHPVQTAAYASLLYWQDYFADQQIGEDRPWYLQLEVPLPFQDEQGNPYSFNPRQMFTFTTPYDLVRTMLGQVPGININAQSPVENFTPVAAAIFAQLAGKDTFTGDDVPTNFGTSVTQYFSLPPIVHKLYGLFGPTDSDFHGLRGPVSDDSNFLYPRNVLAKVAAIILGSLAPKPVNKDKAQWLGQGKRGETPQHKWDTWKQDFEDAFGQKPPKALADAIDSKVEWETMKDRAGPDEDTDNDGQGDTISLSRLEKKIDLAIKWQPQLRRFRTQMLRDAQSVAGRREVDSALEHWLGWTELRNASEDINAWKRRDQ